MTRDQLGYLLDMNEREHIAVHVLPFSSAVFPGSGQSIYYAEGPVPQLDTVNLDQSHGPVNVHAQDVLPRVRPQHESRMHRRHALTPRHRRPAR